MKIGVFVPYHIKLSKYLGAVVEQFIGWDKMVLRKADFSKEDQVKVRNESLGLGCDLVFTIDSDELITKVGQGKLMNLMSNTEHDCILCPVINYTKDFKHRYKMTDHKPVVIIDPKKVKFYETRCVQYSKPLLVDDIYLHHLGFTYSNETIDWKNNNYWNVGNKKEVEQVMRRETELYDMPRELKELLCLT